MSVRERLVHPRFTGLAAREARLATPYGQDRHGLHSALAPLRPHQTCRKAVRLRLVLFDARFILSGSVVHFVTDTSSEGERKRETVTAGVPFLCTPSVSDSQSGIATLTLRSICAGPRRSRGFSSYVAAAGFPPTAPSPFWSRLRSRLQSLRLHSVTQAPSAGPAHTSEGRCRCTFILLSVPEPENRHLSPRPSYRPAPAAPIGLSAHSPEDRKNDADASPFPTSYESSGNMATHYNISA